MITLMRFGNQFGDIATRHLVKYPVPLADWQQDDIH